VLGNVPSSEKHQEPQYVQETYLGRELSEERVNKTCLYIITVVLHKLPLLPHNQWIFEMIVDQFCKYQGLMLIHGIHVDEH
jgi:hypothetical protein